MADERDAEQALLESACKNAEMGISGIDSLLGKTEDNAFREALLNQRREYDELFCTAQEQILRHGGTPKGAGLLKKHMVGISARAKTALDDSTEKMADMMIQGSKLGIEEMTRRLSDYSGTDESVRSVAETLISTEQSNIREMEKHL